MVFFEVGTQGAPLMLVQEMEIIKMIPMIRIGRIFTSSLLDIWTAYVEED
jgi:hypothetical protein